MVAMGLSKKHLKRIGLESLGWLLVLVGVAALVLPGPGLLALFAGMALLATQYEWAERRLDPIRKAAIQNRFGWRADVATHHSHGPVQPGDYRSWHYLGATSCHTWVVATGR